MSDPLTCNCSHFPCGAGVNEECRWAEADHPRFHAERIEAATFCDAVEHHEDSPTTDPETVKAAIVQAASDLI